MEKSRKEHMGRKGEREKKKEKGSKKGRRKE